MATLLGRFAFVLAMPLLVVACVVDSSGAPSIPAEEGSGGGTAPTLLGDGSPSDHPILGLVDTNQTMTAAPGQGVGVFTEYDSGGQWHVWWTCDSDVDTTNPACQFDVTVSVQSGSITDVGTQGFQSSDTLTQSAAQIEAVSTVTTSSEGFDFQTAPGAVITLSATVGGQYSGSFLFFVEGGKVNDGTSGLLSDPIMLQGSMP